MTAVSILVPTYNRELYLKECLDSLLATTVPCEIIVSDNASTDGTQALMARYDDPRIRYFRQATNTGGFDNYNFLLAQASKEYICLFGDDDIALPGCFEKKLAILDHNPDIIGVYSPAWVLDADGNLAPSAKVNGMPDFSLISGRDEFMHMIVNCCISWQTLVFRRERYDSLGGIKNEGQHRYAIDWDYLIEISKGRQMACIAEPTVGVRIHDGSGGNKSAQASGALAEDMLHIWRKWLLEGDDYPVITGNTWLTMQTMIVSGVRICYGMDDLQLKRHLDWFEEIKQAYHERMNHRFYSQLQGWAPESVELADDGLPRFRPGLPPLEIDSLKQVLFFHQIDGNATRWREVLASYVQAFSTTDNVELVLWLDPAAEIPVDLVSEAVDASVARAGIAPDQAPDILLLTDPIALDQLPRLYTAMHVIVPAGDRRQLERGTRVNRLVMTHIAPEAWRKAAEKYLGPLKSPAAATVAQEIPQPA